MTLGGAYRCFLCGKELYGKPIGYYKGNVHRPVGECCIKARDVKPRV